MTRTNARVSRPAKRPFCVVMKGLDKLTFGLFVLYPRGLLEALKTYERPRRTDSTSGASQ